MKNEYFITTLSVRIAENILSLQGNVVTKFVKNEFCY